jgi:hypothetical protein
VLKEGRLKNIITHLKKHGAPADAVEAAAEATAAAAKLQLAEAAKPYRLLPVDKAAGLDVHVHPEVKGGWGGPGLSADAPGLAGAVGEMPHTFLG